MLTVVKIGGAALARRSLHLPEADVVVHGAGPRISQELARAGIECGFVDGRRATPPEAMPHVVRAFRAENRNVCRLVGERAVGLLGHELGLVADHLPELGAVGVLRPSIPAELWQLLAHGVVPVIAPLARGPLNVNADDAAAAIAIGLGADRLVFLSDVPGVLVGGAVVRELHDGAHPELSGGIVPKVNAALDAARAGVTVAIGETAVVA